MALITITSSFGSGGEEIARKVSSALNVAFYDDQRLQEEAVKMGISSKELERLDEKAPGLFDRLFSSRPAVYLDLLGSVVYDVARSGQGVITGHGAQLFLHDFDCALHVRIHASDTFRIQRMMKDKGMGEEAAERTIRRMDRKRAAFMQYAFHRDWNDPSLYDLMVNLDKVGPEWAVKLIKDLAKADEVKACSLNALESMEKSSLQRKIDAAFLEHNLSVQGIHVEVGEGGRVRLTGWCRFEGEKESLINAVKGVAGVSNVASDIFIMPASGV